MKSMKKGFTLVEIMIVVAIIAILAAIAIPNFIAYRNESQENACVANKDTIRTAAETWLTKHPGTTAPGESDLVKSDGTGLLKTWPTCPKGGNAYTIAVDNGAIKVTCTTHDGSGSTETATTGD